MWDILKTIHEGTTTVKIFKIQKLSKDFEKVNMEDDESFNHFYGKLKDIVNTLFNLGEKMFDSKVMTKILRSLQKYFKQNLLL